MGYRIIWLAAALGFASVTEASARELVCFGHDMSATVTLENERVTKFTLRNYRGGTGGLPQNIAESKLGEDSHAVLYSFMYAGVRSFFLFNLNTTTNLMSAAVLNSAMGADVHFMMLCRQSRP